ncbi:interferon gamma [Oxyura jamaicensis]|uniref:interferon gamma n=1 Tax=Oxyura jamaicensis TaxID=8884 RepID=UPI0015A69D60|nr:interferon gamma [Oxyura jamaicensis]
MTCQTYCLFVLSVIAIYFGCSGSALFLSQLQHDIDKLKADFNASNSDVADGNPVFIEKLKNWTERNEKKIILSQIVTLYLEMLKKTDMSKPHIKNLSEQLNTLRDTLSDDYKKFKDLVDLSNLQLTGLKIQRKAVSELFSVLQKLLETSTLKRKRSQSSKRCRC